MAKRDLLPTAVTEEPTMTWMLLVVVAMCWPLVGASPHCELTNISIPLEREECGSCITINVPSCQGFCFTQDPVYKSSLAPYIQHTCSFKEVVYKTIELLDCLDGVNPTVTYPVPLSCECHQCNTDSTDCGALNAEVLDCLSH